MLPECVSLTNYLMGFLFSFSATVNWSHLAHIKCTHTHTSYHVDFEKCVRKKLHGHHSSKRVQIPIIDLWLDSFHGIFSNECRSQYVYRFISFMRHGVVRRLIGAEERCSAIKISLFVLRCFQFYEKKFRSVSLHRLSIVRRRNPIFVMFKCGK